MAEMENNKKDIFDDLVDFIYGKRNRIKDEFDRKYSSDYTFTASNCYDNDWGDCRHHSGINIKSKASGKEYFIGFTGLNFDSGSQNIHSSIGRVQLFIGDGNPNKSIKRISEIKYPGKKDNSLLQVLGTGIYDGRIVINTGYRICGNRKSKDIMLDNPDAIEEFCAKIVEFIKKYENNELMSR